MDGPALTRRERQILESIEADLRQDAGLDRRLSSMRTHRPWHLPRLPHPFRRPRPDGGAGPDPA